MSSSNPSSRLVDAVTFDFWNTICVATTLDAIKARRLMLLREVLADAGATVSDEDLDAALAAVRRTFDEHWKANRQYTHTDGVELLLKALEVELEEVHLERFTGSFTGEAAGYVPELAPNIADVLGRLRDAGVRIGIICDVGLSPSRVLRRHLEHHGVLDRFDHFSFSDEVGWYKPAPQIFEHALAGLGAEPSRAAHVGDLRRTDVGGAIDAGMLAIRYSGLEDDPDPDRTGIEAHHVIADHEALLPILGL